MSLNFLFKKRCLICTCAISDSEEVCAYCQDKLDALKLNQACTKNACHIDEAEACWAYGYLSGNLIQRLKFNADFAVLPFLGRSLGEHIKQAYQDRCLPDAILPVPLHRWRLFRRGFNQTGELGQRLAKQLGLAFNDRLLVKTKQTRPGVNKSAVRSSSLL